MKKIYVEEERRSVSAKECGFPGYRTYYERCKVYIEKDTVLTPDEICKIYLFEEEYVPSDNFEESPWATKQYSGYDDKLTCDLINILGPSFEKSQDISNPIWYYDTVRYREDFTNILNIIHFERSRRQAKWQEEELLRKKEELCRSLDIKEKQLIEKRDKFVKENFLTVDISRLIEHDFNCKIEELEYLSGPACYEIYVERIEEDIISDLDQKLQVSFWILDTAWVLERLYSFASKKIESITDSICKSLNKIDWNIMDKQGVTTRTFPIKTFDNNLFKYNSTKLEDNFRNKQIHSFPDFSVPYCSPVGKKLITRSHTECIAHIELYPIDLALTYADYEFVIYLRKKGAKKSEYIKYDKFFWDYIKKTYDAHLFSMFLKLND